MSTVRTEIATASDAPDDLPPTSAELVAIRTGAMALVRVLGRKRGERFLREWLDLLASEDAIIPIRRPGQVGEVMLARRQALAWLQAVTPTLNASLPPE